MSFEHGITRPESMKEDWEGQFSIFSWMHFVCAVPHLVYLVTTLKEDGSSNAALEGWSSFTGEGDHYYVMLSGLFRDSHTYQNIQRDREFCVNFMADSYADNLIQTIRKNHEGGDEIIASGLTPEPARSIKPARVKESFLKLECELEWERELFPGSRSVTVCGRIKHLAADEDFAAADMRKRLQDYYFIHMMAMKNPYNGQRMPGGIGHVNVIKDVQL